MNYNDDQADIMHMIDGKIKLKHQPIDTEVILSKETFTCSVIDESNLPETVSLKNESLEDNIVKHSDCIAVYFNFDLFSKMVRSDSLCAYFYDLSTKYEKQPVHFYIVAGGDDKLDETLYCNLSYDHKSFLRGIFDSCFRCFEKQHDIPQSFCEKLTAVNATWFIYVLIEYVS